MTVRSLFFATYRDLAGADELLVELPASATVADLVRELRGSRRRAGARSPQRPRWP